MALNYKQFNIGTINADYPEAGVDNDHKALEITLAKLKQNLQMHMQT